MSDVINRMAGNSSSCKLQCVVLITGIFLIAAQTKVPDYALLGMLPTVLFLSLNIYYLALEKSYRDSYGSFIYKLHQEGSVDLSDLYLVRRTGPVNKHILASLRSTSVWPFYLMLVFAIALIWQVDHFRNLPGL